MTRWCSAPRSTTISRFFSPLGLESEGTQIDFQVGANSYLYGTRFFSYLALTYGPDKTVEWLRRSEDSKAFYSSQFKHVFGKPLDDVWDDWIAFEHKFQDDNLARARQISADRAQASQPTRARLDVARLRRRQDQQPDRRLPLSRRSASSAGWTLRPASSRISPTSTA